MLSKTSKYTFESTIDDVSSTCGNDCSVLSLCVALKRSIMQTQISKTAGTGADEPWASTTAIDVGGSC